MESGHYIKYETADEKGGIIILNELGQGSFGTVYRCIREGYGYAAIKIQTIVKPNPNTKINQTFESLKVELEISKNLKSDLAFTVKLIIFNPKQTAKKTKLVGVSDTVPAGNVCSLYDLADGPSLLDISIMNVKNGIVFSETTMKKFAKDLIDCLSVLEAAGVCHDDLKPENLILNKGKICMIDFGLSCFYKECNVLSGTPGFKAPEVFKANDYKSINWEKVDMFAMGCTLFYMLTYGYNIYDITKKRYVSDGQVKKVDNIEFDEMIQYYPYEDLEKQFSKFIKRLSDVFPLLVFFHPLIMGMIKPNPISRWTVEQCKEWLQKN